MVGPRRTRGRRSSGGSAGGMPGFKYAPVREKLDIKDAVAAEPSKPAAEPSPKVTQKPIWTTEVKGDSVIVKSPYEPSLEKEFKKLNGRWAPSENAWVIPTPYKDKAESVLAERLGKNDEERVDVRIKTDGLGWNRLSSFWIGQYSISRPSRDWSVRMSDNIAIIKGGFRLSGGTWKRPTLDPLHGTVLEVRGVPKSIAEKTKAKYGSNVEILK